MDIEYSGLLGRIRADNASKEDMDALHSIHHAQAIQVLVCEKDADWLLAMTGEGDAQKRMAAWRLMKNIVALPRIQSHLRSAWEDDSITELEKSTLLWRVLDDPTLPEELHESIWHWIKENRDSFVNGFLFFMKLEMDIRKTSDREMNELFAVLTRYVSSSKFVPPPSKLWIYSAVAVLSVKDKRFVPLAMSFLEDQAPSMRGTFFDKIEQQMYNILTEENV